MGEIRHIDLFKEKSRVPEDPLSENDSERARRYYAAIRRVQNIVVNHLHQLRDARNYLQELIRQSEMPRRAED